MRYKNIGKFPKTFYGVEIKPGEEKDVPGFINFKNFIRVLDKPKRKKATTSKVTASKPSTHKQKNVVTKAAEKKEPEVKDTEKVLTATNDSVHDVDIKETDKE